MNKSFKNLVLAGAMAALVSGFCFTGCKSAPAEYENPVVDHNCPDPTILDNRARDGYFYAYSTRNKVGETTYEIPVYRSADLVNW